LTVESSRFITRPRTDNRCGAITCVFSCV